MLLIEKYERDLSIYHYVVGWGYLAGLISFFYLLAHLALRSLNWKVYKWKVFIFISSKAVGDTKLANKYTCFTFITINSLYFL
jgi:hypothetical protein